jgi:hypothetical protein
MSLTYLTTDELSKRIKYNPRTIRQTLKDHVLLEGRHYIRPFGQRKILYLWEHIEEDMLESVYLDDAIENNGAEENRNTQPNVKIVHSRNTVIPMANGGICYG